MKHLITFFAVYLIALFAFINAAPTPQASLLGSTVSNVIENKYIVVLKTENRTRTNEAHMNWVNGVLSNTFSSESAGLTHQFDFGTWQAYAINGSQTVAEYLRNDGDVDWVQPVRVSTASGLNNKAPPGLRRVISRTIPAATTPYSFVNSAGAGVDAYVLDTGIKIDHPEFEGRATFGASFVNNGEEIDANGHGTHVAGTIGSKSFGMAPKVSLIAVRVLDASGAGANTDILSGITFILQSVGIRSRPSIVNMSIGGPADAAFDRAINTLVQNGIVVVVAAGNDGVDACNDSPARVSDAITVGAIDPRNDILASFSNTGTCVDLNGPGVNIKSTWIGTSPIDGETGITNTISGTSMACPHVSGAAALLLGVQNTLTPAEVADTLKNFATSDVLTVTGDTPNLLLFTGGSAGFVASQLAQ
ncbi:subtilisin-like serine protease [Nowakowskiella sp. JEL0078]|nr:subtilisin-like serine protease [Nowakowskiella sp. JEL0078]